MGKDSSVPASPDPYKVADAQSQYADQTALYNAGLNRYNTNTPWGSQTWTQGAPTQTFNQQKYDQAMQAYQAPKQTSSSDYSGAEGMSNLGGMMGGASTGGLMPNKNDPSFYDTTPSNQWTQSVSLTPDQQTAVTNTQKTQAGLSGLQGQALNGVSQSLSSNPFDASTLPQSPINAGTTAQQAIMQRLQPQMDLQNKQFDADMANRGIAQGSDPYNQARRSVSNQQDDLMSQAALYGVNEDMTARQQGIQNMGALANMPLNYLNGLMSGSQVQAPNFQSTPGVSAQTPDIQSAFANQYNGQMNAYNAQTASNNSTTSGLMGLAGTAAMIF